MPDQPRAEEVVPEGTKSLRYAGRSWVAAEQYEDVWDLLRDVCDSGVEFDDGRLNYLVIQIDRDTWNQAKEITRV